MPRINFLTILFTAIVSLVCYQVQDRNPYGRYFAEVMEHVEERYVEEVNAERLFEVAVNAMLGELDENSQYIGPDEMAAFREPLEQEFGGIGIEILPNEENKSLTVAATIIDTPAHRAGILAGDEIIKIDGRDVREIERPSTAIRGNVGEAVTLTVRRPGEAQPIDIGPIERAIIPVQSVLGDTRNADGSWNYFLESDPQIAYIRITSFGKRTDKNFDTVMEKLAARGFKALVLDLRNNPGGYLDSAIHISDSFLTSGTIVTTRGRDGEIRDQHEAGAAAPNYMGFPMVVLVNRWSASASEIVAAALQDNLRAIVIGERTYGKGTVQNVIRIGGGRSDLKLTTAYYWRPNNRKIHRRSDPSQKDGREPESGEWGVLPGEEYRHTMSDEEFKNVFEARMERDRPKAGRSTPSPADDKNATIDPHLKMAVEYLKKQLSGAAENSNAA